MIAFMEKMPFTNLHSLINTRQQIVAFQDGAWLIECYLFKNNIANGGGDAKYKKFEQD